MASPTTGAKRSRSCALTLTDVLRELPDAAVWAKSPPVTGVGVYADRSKFFVKYTTRRRNGKQVQVRHGMFDSCDVAHLMTRWLGAQDESVRLTPGATHAFLTAALAKAGTKKQTVG